MSDITVKISEPRLVVKVPVGLPGPQGPAGPAGGTVVSRTSGQALSSGRGIVMEGGQAVYFQPSNLAHAGRMFGISKQSASAPGQTIDIQVGGVFAQSGLGLDPAKPVFVGTDGLLQSVPPTGAVIIQQAGAAESATSLNINFTTYYIN